MKYKDENGNWIDIHVKAIDSLPIGTILDYDGEEIPDGYEKYGAENSLSCEIVENENGTAIKYSNGIMICYGEFTTLCSSWTKAENTYECYVENPLVFPVEFIKRPLSVQVSNTGDKELYRACWIQRAIYTNTGITDLLLGRNTNYSDYFRFSWFAIGKWR